VGGVGGASKSDDASRLAEWLWSVVLRLCLHANSLPPPELSDAESEGHQDGGVHEMVAQWLHGDRQLALAAFLTLTTSRSGHRSDHTHTWTTHTLTHTLKYMNNTAEKCRFWISQGKVATSDR